MSTELPEHLAGWDSVQNALAEVRATHGEFRQFFSEVFDQLDEQLTEIAARKNQWEAEREESENELARQAEKLKKDRAALSSKQKRAGKDAQVSAENTEHLKQLLEEAQSERAEMRDAQQAVHAQVGQLAAATGNDQLGQVLEEIQQQRAELQGAQEAARAQGEQLAAVAAELSGARPELTQKITAAGNDQLGQLLEEIRQQRAELQGAQEAARAQGEQLAAVAAELSGARSELTQKITATGNDQLGQLLEEIQQQREVLHHAQEASQSQTEQLANMAAEAADSRRELAEARSEIAQQCKNLEARQAEAGQGQPGQELQEQSGQMERQQALWEQERALLEAELETVRNRAAEMAESLADQKRQAAGQRAEWADELKRMRRLMENISGRLAEGGFSASGHESDSQRPAAAAEDSTAGTGDAILDSVAAQFDMLQRDLARRRAARSEPQGVS